jgi:hypothetical protein
MSQPESLRIITKAIVKDENLQLDITITEIPENQLETLKKVYSLNRKNNQNAEFDESLENDLEKNSPIHSEL